MDEWHIGDPVDWGDGWMDAQNWGRSYDDDEEKNPHDGETSSQYSERDVYSKKAWDYYLDNKYDDAFYYIDLALDLDSRHSNNWNKKAIILEYMGRYAESEKCYNKSLELRQQSLVADNKARMLRDWAGHLLSESRKMPNGLAKLKEALEKNGKAINALPDDSEENIDRFLSQKRVIESTIKYEKEFHENVEALKKYDKSELFTIAGRQFYKIKHQRNIGFTIKNI